MIDKVASDLCIARYTEETLQQYYCRVIYSAMACWMKAIALDRSVNYRKEEGDGVSRRHMYDRSHVILEMMIKMFPSTKEWFDLSADNDDPINLIRTRMINHGDLLNSGFDTNLALSSPYSKQISSKVETVYGTIMGEQILYSGVSAIRFHEDSQFETSLENTNEWMLAFLKEARWSRDFPESSLIQYYNPHSSAKNNYTAWQESIENMTERVILIRTAMNNNSYSYYLLRPKEKLVHRIDPFLQEQGFHIRIMCALRSQANNKTKVSVTCYNDHVRLFLNALLPLKERVLLESYAWPARKINNKLEWTMSYPIWNVIKPYINALEIQITEDNHG